MENTINISINRNKEEIRKRIIRSARREGRFAIKTLIIFLSYLQLISNKKNIEKGSEYVSYVKLETILASMENDLDGIKILKLDKYNDDIKEFLFDNFKKVFDENCYMPGGREFKEIYAYSYEYIEEILKNLILLNSQPIREIDDYFYWVESTQSVIEKKELNNLSNQLMISMLNVRKKETILDMYSKSGERLFKLNDKQNDLYSLDDVDYNVVQQRLVCACLDKDIYSYEEGMPGIEGSEFYDMYGRCAEELDDIKNVDSFKFDRSLGDFSTMLDVKDGNNSFSTISGYEFSKNNVPMYVALLSEKTRKKSIILVPTYFLIDKTKDGIDVKSSLIGNGYLSSVIYLPKRYTSYSTRDKALLIIDKECLSNTIYFVDLSNESTNLDIDDICKLIEQRKDTKNTKRVIGSKIVKNNYNLGKGNYFEKIEEKERINIDALKKERRNLLHKYRRELSEINELIERR